MNSDAAFSHSAPRERFDPISRTEERLAVRAPFHMEATVRVLQRRATNRVDLWRHGSYIRLFELPAGLALVRVTNRGTIDDPKLYYTILRGSRSLGMHAAVRRLVTRVLGLDVDPAPLQTLATADPRLRDTVLALRGMRPPRFSCLFEAFASIIPFQQLSLDAGISILGKLVDRFGEPLTFEDVRYSAFPSAAAIANAALQDLQSCGLSLKKAQTLHAIARMIDAGELREHSLARMDSAEALEHLVALPGIGPWTAGLVLLRGLGRTDVFPSGDVGAARELRKLLKLEAKQPIETLTERFGAARGYLYFCCLGGSLLERGHIAAAGPSARS